MSLSIVVPTYNSERTIRQCLQAIFKSGLKDIEVIVVDDASTDSTLNIVADFPCRVIRSAVNHGPSYARTVAIRESRFDIVVFIDSDIIINNETLSKTAFSFEREPEIAAVVGLLSKEHPNNNFFSVYKNLYMNYIFNESPIYIDFIYGSFYAVRKRFVDFQTKIDRIVEDTELGMRLYQKGCKILLNKELEVVHLKRYTFRSFIKNDFLVAYNWFKLFMEYGGVVTVLKKKRFFHAKTRQLLSLVIAPISLLCIFFYPWPAALFFLLFITLNLHFFIFCHKERGAFFMVKSIAVTWLDMLVMDSGIMASLISHYAQCFGGRHRPLNK